VAVATKSPRRSIEFKAAMLPSPMSALTRITDSSQTLCHVRFGCQQADIAQCCEHKRNGPPKFNPDFKRPEVRMPSGAAGDFDLAGDLQVLCRRS